DPLIPRAPLGVWRRIYDLRPASPRLGDPLIDLLARHPRLVLQQPDDRLVAYFSTGFRRYGRQRTNAQNPAPPPLSWIHPRGWVPRRTPAPRGPRSAAQPSPPARR